MSSSFRNGPWRKSTSSPSSSASSSPTRSPRSSHSRTSSSSSGSSASSNWRVTARPPTPRPTMPDYKDVELGMVFRLPDTPPPPSSIIHQKLAGSNSTPWNHAVVVVRKWSRNDQQYVDFRTCTSFRHRRIEAAKPLHHRTMYVLADNHEDVVPHDGTGLATMAPSSAKFKDRTYVNLSQNSEYSIEYKQLGPWGSDKPMKFDALWTGNITKCIDKVKPPMAHA